MLDFEGPFREAVIDPFVEEYAAGRTPNPCVRCNRFVRFPQLWRKARLLGAEYVATGHYARAVSDGNEVGILRPADRAKDQTFYLWGLGRPLLARSLFPLGDLSKNEVRARAAELGFRVAEKPESQDICFIPDGDLRGFHPDEIEVMALLTRYHRQATPKKAHDGYADLPAALRRTPPSPRTASVTNVPADSSGNTIPVG